MLLKKPNLVSGFTLVELLVGVAVFTIILVSVYSSYKSIFDVVYTSRAKIDAIDLVNEQMEIIRNLPYGNVGIANGVPSGTLAHSQTLVRGSSVFSVLTTVRNIDDPFDGTLGGTPNDTSPADYKLVEIEVNCATCKNFSPMIVTTRVAPKNLETASTNGALVIKVFDGSGNAIPDASIHIENNQIAPAVRIDDVTNNQGILQVVDVRPGNTAYEITVTKNGYSTDKTYAVTISNPHPTKPFASVLLQQVTQISFAIDKLSALNLTSVNTACQPVPAIDFSLQGSKKVGTNPDVFKYSQSGVTNGSGFVSLNALEWDTYSIANLDSVYEFVGQNPLFPVSLSPDSNQSAQMIVAPKNPKTLLVVVRDGAASLPLSGVTVEIVGGAIDNTSMTGQGFQRQTDWSGDSGQATSTDMTKYFSSDGNIETQNPVGSLTLKKVFGQYVPNGVLTSSSFDTGATSNLNQIDWNPVGQPATSNIRFQIATNNDGGTWNFSGPDGTASTFYTRGSRDISSLNNGNRYFRYKLFLDSSATSTSPNISDISMTYTLSCTPPGQVSFSGLSSGTYTLHLSKSGYVSQDVTVNISQPWQEQDVVMQSN